MATAKILVLYVFLVGTISLVSGRTLAKIGVAGVSGVVQGPGEPVPMGIYRPPSSPGVYRGGWLNGYGNMFRPRQPQRTLPIIFNKAGKRAATGESLGVGNSGARPILAPGRDDLPLPQGPVTSPIVPSVPLFSISDYAASVQLPIPIADFVPGQMPMSNPAAPLNSEAEDRQYTVVPEWYFLGSGYAPSGGGLGGLGYGLNGAPELTLPVPVPVQIPLTTSPGNGLTTSSVNWWPYYTGYDLGQGYTYFPLSSFPGFPLAPNQLVL